MRSGLRKRSNASHVVPYIGLQVMRAARRSTKTPARALPAAVPTRHRCAPSRCARYRVHDLHRGRTRRRSAPGARTPRAHL